MRILGKKPRKDTRFTNLRQYDPKTAYGRSVNQGYEGTSLDDLIELSRYHQEKRSKSDAQGYAIRAVMSNEHRPVMGGEHSIDDTLTRLRVKLDKDGYEILEQAALWRSTSAPELKQVIDWVHTVPNGQRGLYGWHLAVTAYEASPKTQAFAQVAANAVFLYWQNLDLFGSDENINKFGRQVQEDVIRLYKDFLDLKGSREDVDNRILWFIDHPVTAQAQEEPQTHSYQRKNRVLTHNDAERIKYCQVLGIKPEELGALTLRKAYRKQAFEWHPDRWKDGNEFSKAQMEARFKEVNKAHEYLDNLINPAAESQPA